MSYLETTDDLKRALGEPYRVLKPHGRVAALLYFYDGGGCC